MELTYSNQSEFIGLLKKIAPYMSKDETRYYLCGVYFTVENDLVYLVATDGHRLLKINTKIESKKPIDAIVPCAAVKTIISAKGISKDLPLIITIENTRMIFDFIGFQITTKLVDGNYPDYNKAIPKVDEVKSNHAFRASYLIDALKTFGDDGVRVGYKTDSSHPEMEPVVIKGASDDIISVLMPRTL